MRDYVDGMNPPKLFIAFDGNEYLLGVDAGGLPDLLVREGDAWRSLKKRRQAREVAMRLCDARGLHPRNHTQQALRALFLFEHAKLSTQFFESARW